MYNLLKNLNHYNQTGEVIACDESLEEHDKKYHGGHYDPKTQSCGKREEMAKGDDQKIDSGRKKVYENEDLITTRQWRIPCQNDIMKWDDSLAPDSEETKKALASVKEVGGAVFPNAWDSDKENVSVMFETKPDSNGEAYALHFAVPRSELSSEESVNRAYFDGNDKRLTPDRIILVAKKEPPRKK